MDMEFHKVVAATTAAGSFILLGNAITQTYMTLPALLLDFPRPSSPSHTQRARLLGRQWPIFWTMGNNFFRPLSTAGILGYGVAAYSLANTTSSLRGGWKLYALATVCHLVTVVHSARNMQPINEKLDGLRTARESELAEAEGWGRMWMRLNLVRVVMPAVAGGLAMWTVVRSR